MKVRLALAEPENYSPGLALLSCKFAEQQTLQELIPQKWTFSPRENKPTPSDFSRSG